MTERWMMYLDTEYRALPWPWPGKLFDDIDREHVTELPYAIADFTRYSPSDGPIDMVHVPREMPREAPVCTTRLAVYHDTDNIYVFIDAIKTTRPIPELADCDGEDFSVVIPLGGLSRGLYFGLNEKGEGIGCVQIWDPDIQPGAADDEWPFSLLKSNPGDGPATSRGGILDSEYTTRIIETDSSLVGCIRVEKRLIASGVHCNTLELTVGRRCFATGEIVSWGSTIIWTPRPDQHGTVILAESGERTHLPKLHRVDMIYDPLKESGCFEAVWSGAVTPEDLGKIDQGTYASFAAKVTLALNGIEQTCDIASRTAMDFDIPDGWNRPEILTAFAPPLVLNFEKHTGQRITASRADGAELPPMDELKRLFADWHKTHERSYLGDGIWGDPDAPRHCLCHCGVFNMEPYVLACQYLVAEPVYEQRIEETCARMLAAQHADGWFPCHCSAISGEPDLGDGGAFTNGSVGEGLVLASVLMDNREWLESSIRAADYSWYRWEHNQNYVAFALWHLAALQEIDPRDEWITKGLYYAGNFVTRDIGPSGAQNGHNYFTGYGYITLKGLIRFLSVLPVDHEFYPVLKEKTIRFTNQMLSRQQPDGKFAGRNRKYLGYSHYLAGMFFVADALPELVDALTPAITSMVQALVRQLADGREKAGGLDVGLNLALAAKHLQKSSD